RASAHPQSRPWRAAGDRPRSAHPHRRARALMSEDGTADLAARAAHRHVVVVGGGMAGLVAARECAKVGMNVTVLEAAGELGGAIRRAALDGVTVDAGAESYATRGGHVRKLLDELGLADRIVTPNPAGAWLV